MAMMISKFNALIRSRLLWGAFLVVIVLSFVVWGMPSCNQGESTARNASEGTLNGREVSPAEFAWAYRMACLDLLLRYGQDRYAGEGLSERLRGMAWERMALLEQAKKWNLNASDEDVRRSIAVNFAGPDGAFDRATFDRFYADRVRPMGFTRAQFEAYFGEALVLQRVEAVAATQARVTPGEVEQAFHSLMDTWVVDYAKVESAPLAEAAEADENAAKALFDEDPSRFRLPETREAEWAVVPFGDGEGLEVADSDVEDYYAENVDLYETTTTGEDGAVESSVKPLDEVRGDIEATLRAEASKAKAEETAMGLVSAAMPARDGTKTAFADAAASLGLESHAAGPFGIGDAPVEGCPGFATEAFQRELGAFDAVSDPIETADGWLVLKLTAIHEPRVPEFDEVREAALAAAKDRAVKEAVDAKVAELKAAAEAAGGSLSAGAKAVGLEAKAAAPFTVFEATSGGDETQRALAAVVAQANPGELTDAAPVAGGVLVAQVKNRVAADEASFETYKDEIESMLRRQRAVEAVALWQEAVMSGVQDRRAQDEEAAEAVAQEEEAAAGEPAAPETDLDGEGAE
ncbi:MAG: peptidylprolyl isomerase [Kiritimatiellae bacterium]|nr:peptidylprolyl isomerase [Kiritimatiellia bacterium]